MTWTQIYLLFFVVGGLWSLVTVLAGAGFLSHLHFGHSHSAHSHLGHHAHAHSDTSVFGSLLHPSGVAIFFAWFGTAGMHKITGDMTQIAAQIPTLFESLSGMQMSDLLGKIKGIDRPANGKA